MTPTLHMSFGKWILAAKFDAFSRTILRFFYAKLVATQHVDSSNHCTDVQVIIFLRIYFCVLQQVQNSNILILFAIKPDIPSCNL